MINQQITDTVTVSVIVIRLFIKLYLMSIKIIKQ